MIKISFARALASIPFAPMLLAPMVLAALSLAITAPVVHAAPGSATFVGADACKSCHPKQTQAWKDSHHDLAMQPATPATVLADFDGTRFDHHGTISKFEREGDRYFVTTDGPDGKLTKFQISYVFGVDPLQQYMVRFPDGRVQVLGIAWDARSREAGGQRWFHIYPDDPLPHDDILHWTGPNQNWNHMCAECHSTNLRKNYDAENNRFDTSWSEIDVACEACHGPSSLHVAQAKSGQYDAKDTGLGIRFEPRSQVTWTPSRGAAGPRRIPPHLGSVEVDACARCHSRRSPIHEDYRHGRALLDQHRVAPLDDGLYFPDGQILEEVYVYGSFVQSRMFGAGVTCSDCHDPHSATLRAEGNALCGRCHTPSRFDTKDHHHHPAQSEGAQCVACHMPTRTYMEVDPRHDHSLRVPRPDLSDALGTPNACTGCHATMTNVWASRKIAKWTGGKTPEPHWGEAIHAGRTSARDAGARLVGVIADPEVPAIARATAVGLLPRYPSEDAVPAFQLALSDPDPMVRTAAVGALEAFEAETRAQVAVGHLSDPVRAVRFETARVLAALPPGSLRPADQRKLDSVLEDYRAAQQMDADRGDAHMRLATLYMMQGDAVRAEKELEAARRLEPSFVPAYVNLADLYRALDRDTEGEAVLREALALQPENGDVHHALGLLLVRQQRLDEAVVALEEAVKLRPDNPRYAFIYAVALHSSDRIDEARAVLRAANVRFPGDPQIASFLAQIEKKR